MLLQEGEKTVLVRDFKDVMRDYENSVVCGDCKQILFSWREKNDAVWLHAPIQSPWFSEMVDVGNKIFKYVNNKACPWHRRNFVYTVDGEKYLGIGGK